MLSKTNLKTLDHDLRTSDNCSPEISVKWSRNRKTRCLRICWEGTASFLIPEKKFVCNREVESVLSSVVEVVLRVPVEYHLGLSLQPLSEEKHN